MVLIAIGGVVFTKYETNFVEHKTLLLVGNTPLYVAKGRTTMMNPIVVPLLGWFLDTSGETVKWG